MKGHFMSGEYHLSDGVKALIAVYVKEQSEEALIKALNQMGKENFISSKELKHIAIDEFKKEIDNLATKDLLHSEIFATKEFVRAEIAELRTELKQDISDLRSELKQEIAEVRQDVSKLETKLLDFQNNTKYWAITIIILMLVLQPRVMDFIQSIFGVVK